MGQTSWDAARARFMKESLALQVPHPSILQVRDYGEEGDIIYVVTDLVEGPSLRELLTKEVPMPAERVRVLMLDLARAASAVHKRGGLVCGLTPEIIRVTREGGRERLLISSGGIVQIEDLLATVSEQSLRGVGLVDPEWFYMAPELLSGQPPDVRSDIYTMGALAYEMATGTVPFTASTLPELSGLVMAGTVRDPRNQRATFPDAVAEIILKSLSRDPADRQQTAAAFAEALGRGT
jgi:serine/threonine protein kinase